MFLGVQKGIEDSFTLMTGDSFQLFKPVTNPTASGFSSVTTNWGWYKVVGSIIYYGIRVEGTSNATTFIINFPIAGSIAGSGQIRNVFGYDNTTPSTIRRSDWFAQSKTMTLYTTQAGTGTWTASGTKGAFFNGFIFNNQGI